MSGAASCQTRFSASSGSAQRAGLRTACATAEANGVLRVARRTTRSPTWNTSSASSMAAAAMPSAGSQSAIAGGSQFGKFIPA